MPKKKTALTIEERLQQALVSAEEQPYEVPENWVWVRLGSLAQDMADGPFGSNLKTEHYTNNKEVRIIQLSNIGENGWREDNKKYTTFEHAKVIARSKVEAGDIVIAKMMPAGRAIICPSYEQQYVLSSDAVKFVPNSLVDNNFCCKGINSYFFQTLVQENTQGITRARTSIKKLKGYPFPLPPLSEQQRIVERIEELFAKLGEAKERLQEVADSFAVRKAAILHKAFTGELTKKHEIEDSIVIRDKLFAERENMVQEKVLKRVKIKPLIQDEYKSQLAKNWVQCKLGEVAFVTKLAGFEYTKYIHLEDTGEIPVVRAQNVRKGYLDTTNLLYISKSVSDALSRSALKEKSVLITFIGAGIGDACVFDENQQYHLAPNVAKVEPFNKSEEKLNVYFLLYYLLSSFGQYEIFKNMKATAQPSLSMETIREIIIPLPSIEEQHEIVRLIDDLLARERSAQQATEQALASIDLMKKSILARAFRGELGTNKASEASALELLKQVLAEG